MDKTRPLYAPIIILPPGPKKFPLVGHLFAMPSEGSDTTVASLGTFVLGMLLNPEVQKKAQAELDAVLGPGQLPDFVDDDSLPYVSAIVKETLRWRPAVPIK
ncbi:cytochrome P450 [Favolaschia claudopus]|uniref:Cytochrome P450 n=1 Tax=Favolaschia claudopus TaxID=2862362 RepID=A0AAV9ZLE6_9AGAR